MGLKDMNGKPVIRMITDVATKPGSRASGEAAELLLSKGKDAAFEEFRNPFSSEFENAPVTREKGKKSA